MEREAVEEDEVSSQASNEGNEIEMDEIMEEDIPDPPTHYTHYYVSIEDECSYLHESSIAELVSSQPCSQFLKLPQIQIPSSSRVTSEPIIDYSNSQILTSTAHVDKLNNILEKKARVEEERARKQEEREPNKAKRAEEKVATVTTKRRKLLNKKQEKLVDKVGLL